MAPRKKKPAGPKPVEAHVHPDKRTNIPTADAQEFVDPESTQPISLRYPRDTSLDPQLVWKGKDEQDADDLEVAAPPIFIQEKIDPRVLVENLRRTAKAGEVEPELTLFDSFDGLDEFDSVDFYQHDANWSNRMILGDSLQVMASLAEREGLRGKVQMVYIDPPYGIGFGSNWQASSRKKTIKDGLLSDVTLEVEQIKAFRDTWELGINSYLAYLRDRLVVARDLLTTSGSCFVQIGDENMHLVRVLMDEVFGRENFAASLSFRTKIPLRTTLVPAIYDRILWYALDKENLKFRRLFGARATGDGTQFTKVQLPDGTRRNLTKAEKADPENVEGRLYRHTDLVSAGRTESCVFKFDLDGRQFGPSGEKSWKTNPEGMAKLLLAGRIEAPSNTPNYVFFADDYPVQELTNVWSDTQGASDKSYVVQTASKVVQRCLLMATDPGDLVLDPTCGSGTTAYVAEQFGRRWITSDTSRVALALSRQRLMGAEYPYYMLADSPEGRLKEAQVSGSEPSSNPTSRDIRRGFVLDRVPHVTLGSITNNPDIKEGMGREAIDEAIVRHAELEMLVDRPFTDNKKVRVSGPFTIESLSPYRSLAFAGAESGETGEHRSKSELSAEQDAVGFETMILDNLQRSPIQNGRRDERLEFASIESYPGDYVQAVGETDEDDSQRVGISIGPQYGTVGASFIKNAAREALKADPKLDMLAVLAFSFDPLALGKDNEYVSTTEGFADVAAERSLGRLPVLLVRMNNDLVMGEDLKKTGAGNLFTVFGQPDIDIRRDGDDVTVEILGVDVYDPSTGQVRSNDTGRIALWMIDTNYNEESFFVRHCYFTGGNDPYKKLKKTLKADIDEQAWESLKQTTSRSFPAPQTGKIAIKVINDYGDEVMQVFEV